MPFCLQLLLAKFGQFVRMIARQSVMAGERATSGSDGNLCRGQPPNQTSDDSGDLLSPRVAAGHDDGLRHVEAAWYKPHQAVCHCIESWTTMSLAVKQAAWGKQLSLAAIIGRLARPAVPWHLRRCTLCQTRSLGDERHFVF